MENLIEAIRIALRDDADPIARRAGLVSCRKILAVLETATDAKPAAPDAALTNEPTEAPSNTPPTAATPVASPMPAPPIDPAAVATLIAALGKLPPEQLLDLAIARLRAVLPPGTTVPTPSPLRFQLLPLHHLERAK